jgi:uncharacterized DUF497 family protein
MSMQIEYDPAKDRLNRQKHGVGLEVATEILATPSVQWTSLRDSHGEVRIVAVGLLGGLEFTCVYTMRGQGRRQVARIISVRRSRREKRERFWKIRRAQARQGDGDA